MSSQYILEGHTAVPAPDPLTWGRWFQDNDRRVGLDIVGDFRVSTVFLGLDHSFGSGPPLLFETMIFRGDSSRDLFCERYTTWEQAEAGHARAIALAKTPEKLDAVDPDE